ncbi:cuticle protein 16.8-like protein, partial [Dinothrombium tinctorium]
MLKFILVTFLATAVLAQYQEGGYGAEESGYGAQDIGGGYGGGGGGGRNGYKASYQEEQYKPQPYNFEYKVDDNYGNSHYQKEEGDDYGNKRGSYGYMDAYGVYREVQYVADENGFRATIKTNEPGTANANPADVMLQAEEPPAQVNPGTGGKAAAYKADNYASGAQYKPQYQAAGDYNGRASRGYGQASRGYNGMSSYKSGPQRSYSFQRPTYARPSLGYKRAYAPMINRPM